MTDRRPKHECPVCHMKVRRIGKHMNQKHPIPPLPPANRSLMGPLQ